MRDLKLTDMIKHLLKENDGVNELELQKQAGKTLPGMAKSGTAGIGNIVKAVKTRTSDLVTIADANKYSMLIAQITDAIRSANNESLNKQEIVAGLKKLIAQYSAE